MMLMSKTAKDAIKSTEKRFVSSKMNTARLTAKKSKSEKDRITRCTVRRYSQSRLNTWSPIRKKLTNEEGSTIEKITYNTCNTIERIRKKYWPMQHAIAILIVKKSTSDKDRLTKSIVPCILLRGVSTSRGVALV